MNDIPRCKTCRVYLAACKELSAKLANRPNKELEKQLVLGTMRCTKKNAWIQPLCFCDEWEGE